MRRNEEEEKNEETGEPQLEEVQGVDDPRRELVQPVHHRPQLGRAGQDLCSFQIYYLPGFVFPRIFATCAPAWPRKGVRWWMESSVSFLLLG